MPDLPSLLDPRDPDPERGRTLDAWLELQRVGALRPVRTARALVAAGGDPMRAARLLATGRAGGSPPAAPAAAPGEARRRLAACGARGLPLGSLLYPERLRRLDDPAPLLWVRGEPQALSAPAVAVVGSRRATAAGCEAARALGRELAEVGLAVVSGLARGIDAAAHEGALEAGGTGVAVLGCGIDRVYPRQHEGLAARLARSGAVLGELPPGADPLPHHFPLRNRLISGLAAAVVVVEARERSGSLVTARHALHQGADVLAMPGPPRSPAHRGSNLLLRDGAWPCLDVEDVLRALGLPPRAEPDADPRAPGAHRRDAAAPASQRAILEALRQEPATPDELARRLERSAAALGADLVHLELAGRLAREADGRLVVKS